MLLFNSMPILSVAAISGQMAGFCGLMAGFRGLIGLMAGLFAANKGILGFRLSGDFYPRCGKWLLDLVCVSRQF
jgi:hypothetical protein